MKKYSLVFRFIILYFLFVGTSFADRINFYDSHGGYYYGTVNSNGGINVIGPKNIMLTGKINDNGKINLCSSNGYCLWGKLKPGGVGNIDLYDSSGQYFYGKIQFDTPIQQSSVMSCADIQREAQKFGKIVSGMQTYDVRYEHMYNQMDYYERLYSDNCD